MGERFPHRSLDGVASGGGRAYSEMMSGGVLIIVNNLGRIGWRCPLKPMPASL